MGNVNWYTDCTHLLMQARIGPRYLHPHLCGNQENHFSPRLYQESRLFDVVSVVPASASRILPPPAANPITAAPETGCAICATGGEAMSIRKLHFRFAEDDNGCSEEVLPMHVVGGVG